MLLGRGGEGRGGEGRGNLLWTVLKLQVYQYISFIVSFINNMKVLVTANTTLGWAGGDLAN